MRKYKKWRFLSGAIVFLMTGCAPLVLGGAAIGTGTGVYFYVHGELQRDYNASFERVWNACEKTMADMHAVNVQPYKEIGSGNMSSIIDGEEVQIKIEYKAKNLTTVGIRVGTFGNKTASQLLHDKIAKNLFNP